MADRNRHGFTYAGKPESAGAKRKPKMIQAWKRERLDMRILSAITLLYVYGLLTEKQAFDTRTRFLKVAKKGAFDE